MMDELLHARWQQLVEIDDRLARCLAIIKDDNCSQIFVALWSLRLDLAAWIEAAKQEYADF